MRCGDIQQQLARRDLALLLAGPAPVDCATITKGVSYAQVTVNAPPSVLGTSVARLEGFLDAPMPPFGLAPVNGLPPP